MPARSARVGYLLAISAAAMWALNGTLARFLLDDGISALRLAQLRSLLSWAILVAAVAALPAPEALAASQILGGLVVVAAAIWIQLQRISVESEAAPEHMSRLDEPAHALGSSRRP